MSKIDKSKKYLKDNCHRSFEKYITKNLAGDFAVEIVEHIEKITGKGILNECKHRNKVESGDGHAFYVSCADCGKFLGVR